MSSSITTKQMPVPAVAPQRKQDRPMLNLIAGFVAGAVEPTVTYPMEYLKTQAQLQDKSGARVFNGPWDCARRTIKTQGFFALYKGLPALVIGTASKSAVRFVTFEHFKSMMADSEGKVTSMQKLLAGLGSGVVEGALVVTPTETIKTKLIHDQNRPVPQYRGLVHGVSSIVREEGVMGIYRGLGPVVLRQGANQSVRFFVFETLKSYVMAREAGRNTPLPWYTTFGIGMGAGFVTVYTTAPLDVLKTRMQGLDAKARYKNSLDCIVQIVRHEGVLALWKGSTARLGRLAFSGGIVFTVYEHTLQLLQQLSPPVKQSLAAV